MKTKIQPGFRRRVSLVHARIHEWHQLELRGSQMDYAAMLCWIDRNVTGYWTRHNSTFYFEQEADAVVTTLRCL
jgi:hypothetical protein